MTTFVDSIALILPRMRTNAHEWLWVHIYQHECTRMLTNGFGFKFEKFGFIRGSLLPRPLMPRLPVCSFSPGKPMPCQRTRTLGYYSLNATVPMGFAWRLG
jgi:hypothetical protein